MKYSEKQRRKAIAIYDKRFTYFFVLQFRKGAQREELLF